MDTYHIGKRFLAQAAFGPQAAQVAGKAVLDIQTPTQARPSPINLQTISDNVVDFICRQSGSAVTYRRHYEQKMIRKLMHKGLMAAMVATGPLHAQPRTTVGAPTKSIDRSKEGDWGIVDSTDNNTGEREVYALKMHFEENEPDWITLTLRCADGKPTIFIRWVHLEFPDQTVLTIEPTNRSRLEPADDRYLFEKSLDPVESGLRASPATSARIVTAIGRDKYVMIIAHLSSGTVARHLEFEGTQRAWNRVSQHCPVRRMPQPPM